MDERRNLCRLLKPIRRTNRTDVHRCTGIVGHIKQVHAHCSEPLRFLQHRPQLWECIGAHLYTDDAFTRFKHLLHRVIVGARGLCSYRPDFGENEDAGLPLDRFTSGDRLSDLCRICRCRSTTTANHVRAKFN